MSAKSNFISGLVMLGVTAIFYVASLEIEEDPFGVGMEPYVFPLAVCYVLGGLSLLQLAVSARGVFSQIGEKTAGQELRLFLFWVLPMATIAFAYLGLINLFQYLLPTIVTLSATLAVFGNRGVKWLLVIPVAASLVYYVIFFGIFRLLEPTGILLEYDNFYLFGTMRKFIGI